MNVSREGKSSVHSLLLAAGMSERFGSANKLLAEIGGSPLVRRVADCLLASRAAAVTVVVGFQAERIKDALAGLELPFVTNPDFEEGLSSSLRYGIAALGDQPSGAMIALADMPGTSAALIDTLIDAFEREDGEKIVFPVDASGRQGNPVIWPRDFFEALRQLSGDRGAKNLIELNHARAHGVRVADERTFRDIDAPADLAAWDEPDKS